MQHQFSFSARFLGEVVSYALAIAKQVRNENHLQSLDVLFQKFTAERIELQEAENPIDEIPDVVYYALCMAAQGDAHFIERVEQHILPRYAFSQSQVEAMVRGKYVRRASGQRKDVEAERAAMLVEMAKVAS